MQQECLGEINSCSLKWTNKPRLTRLQVHVWSVEDSSVDCNSCLDILHRMLVWKEMSRWLVSDQKMVSQLTIPTSPRACYQRNMVKESWRYITHRFLGSHYLVEFSCTWWLIWSRPRFANFRVTRTAVTTFKLMSHYTRSLRCTLHTMSLLRCLQCW